MSKITLSNEEKNTLNVILKSRTEPAHHKQRANILLLLLQPLTNAEIAKHLNISTKPVFNTYHRYMERGLEYALNDRPRSGKTPIITFEHKMKIINYACTKPKDIGYASEIWTQSNLAKHIRTNNQDDNGLKTISQSSISRVCKENAIKPFNIEYYITKRDPEFESKMINVLQIYKEIEYGIENNKITVSIDEKPGVQAIQNISPDIMPKLHKARTIRRDPEYKRLGTASIIAGVNLHTGELYGKSFDRHRSVEYIEVLSELNNKIDENKTIRLISDNHIIHKSKETMKYIASLRADRFELVFLPKHGSWLNPIEGIFSKMARSFLKAIRVESKQELHDRISLGMKELNSAPKPNNWSKFIEKYFSNTKQGVI